MNLPAEIFGAVIVVHTPEEVGHDQAANLTAHLLDLERRLVVVDLDGTESFDSTGLTALVDALDQLRGLGGDMKLTTNNVNNCKILEMTRLDELFEVYDSVVDAVRSYQTA